MVSSFICGTGSLPREDDEGGSRSAGSTPKRSRGKNRNPYSTRGLDKFSALLAEIQEKREQVYSRVDPDEISLVRFVYSNQRECKPIVVKRTHKDEEDHNKTTAATTFSSSLATTPTHRTSVAEEARDTRLSKKNKKGLPRSLRVQRWRHPEYYLPATVIIILLFMAIFGRSAAVMFTSIGWYLLPTIINKNSDSRKMSFKKKDYITTRRLSEKNMLRNAKMLSFKNGDHRKSF